MRRHPDPTSRGHRRIAITTLMVISLLIYATPASEAEFINTPPPASALQSPQGDWAIVIAIVGTLIAAGSLAVAIRNSPSKPPLAESIVEATADDDIEGDMQKATKIDVPATAVALAIGTRHNPPSTSFTKLTMTNKGKGRWSANTDNSGGLPRGKGGVSSGQLTGKIDGTVVVDKKNPSVPGTTTTLQFQPQLSGALITNLTVPGNSLSLDLSYSLSATSSSPYLWGFTAVVGDDGVLSITDRRGVFSDSDVLISGGKITNFNPPTATFENVPIHTPVEYGGGIDLGASETSVPEPGSALLLILGFAGLIGAVSWRRRGGRVACPRLRGHVGLPVI